MNRNVSLSTPLAPHVGADHPRGLDDAQMLADEALYCSYGDTVHYSEPPRIFERCVR